MNPAQWLQRAAVQHPSAPALHTCTQLETDYEGFARQAACLAGALSARGIGPGDRVGIFMSNCTDYLRVFYGILWSGAAVIPINGKLHAREAAWILADAQAALCFVTPDLADSVAEALGAPDAAACPVIVAGSADCMAMFDADPLEAPQHMGGDDMAWLFYTSGTTGKPKGVMITAGNVAAMTLSYFVDVDEVSHGDAILYSAPMSHGAGIYNFMHVLRAARHVVPESGGFDPAEIFQLSRSVGNVSMFAAPTMVRRLVDHARATGDTGAGIRTVVYAGGPMYLADIVEAVDVLGDRFVQVYGQGECPMAITALSRRDVSDRSHPRWRDRLASVGLAQTVSEVAILDPGGQPVARGETGEIAVRGAGVMRGYWNRPDATAETIRDGWLWTGDMGRMDADGYVTMVDRSKDMIISGGSNVYPREVEEVLLTHPEVAEASVVGRAHPDWGEEVVAFVVPIPGQSVSEADLDGLCLNRIARFKRPKAYVFVSDLPKNNYGKVLKTDLRARLRQA